MTYMEKMITTPCGNVRGTVENGVMCFKGIHYAHAERWGYPTVVENWDGTFDATKYGDSCFQPRAFTDESKDPDKLFYFREFREGCNFTYSEDCLVLNIWAPENAKDCPVLFYIHGGGFKSGSADEIEFDGPVWPEHGVIAVTINYRLGPMGFMALPELEAEAGAAGNYALLDQVAAMQWVKNNISAFGGDPENVTIMGQSAGAMSVQQHLLSPMTEGLFNRAILSSGGGVSEFLSAMPAKMSYALCEKVMKAAGCSNLAEFRAVEPAKIFEAWAAVLKEDPKAAFAMSPVIDGRYIVGTGVDLVKAGKSKNVDVMLGTTSEDMMAPMLFQMAFGYAKTIAAMNDRKTYMWFFDRQLPGDDVGAWHSSDLWYWFGTLGKSWRPMEKRDYDLSKEMVSYLMNFVRTGNPNGEGLEEWKAVDPASNALMRFGEKPAHMDEVDPASLKVRPKMPGMPD